MIAAAAVAILIPLGFLWLVRRLDLYASGTSHAVVTCMLGGIAAFLAAYLINSTLAPLVGYMLMITLIAPIVEEMLKSLVLIYYVRQPDFTYFVDGAIYGFGTGVAFAVVENLLYLSRIGSESPAYSGLALAITRAFSTSLMHGSASALVGVALGRLRFGHGITRIAAVVLGWVAAMSLHLAFNNLISQPWGFVGIILAILVGLSAVGLNILLIRWGLHEERAWLRETLGRATGVSQGEAAVVQEFAQLDRLLAPVAQRFGAEKRAQVEKFLRLQAQLGLKRKVETMTTDVQLQETMAAEIAQLRDEVDVLRRTIGVYCMSYVRSILPPVSEGVWERLNTTLATPPPTAPTSLWSRIGNKLDQL